LNEAPKTYLTAIRKVEFQRQLEIQDIIVDKFPNVSIVNVTEIVSKMIKLFSAMSFAIGVMSLCCISVGLFVLYSILQSQMHRKQKDFALQKITGMSESEIFMAMFYEYIIIVLSALGLGAFFGLGLALIVSQVFLGGIFSINYEFFFYFNFSLIIICIGVILYAFKKNYNKNIKELLLV
jgi:putative ABC transport system permease protein